ncbi:MAG: enoyl-CoA hydratase/isomerase family protein [Pseudomonadota bacterium]
MKDIATEIADGFATVTLDRPSSLNAMTPALMGELRDAVHALDRNEDVKAIVLTGRGRAFSAGGDRAFLDELGSLSTADIKSLVYENFQGAVKAVKLCRKPTIAAINGPAVGAGCELTLACDFRLASTEAYFLESWVHLGVIAPLGGMSLLPQIVGLGRATEMLMLGERINADRAYDIGLVRAVVTPDELMNEAIGLAKRLSVGPPLAYAAFKEGLRRGAENALTAEWEANLNQQALLIKSADFAEAVAASAERRKPRFTGD